MWTWVGGKTGSARGMTGAEGAGEPRQLPADNTRRSMWRNGVRLAVASRCNRTGSTLLRGELARWSAQSRPGHTHRVHLLK